MQLSILAAVVISCGAKQQRGGETAAITDSSVPSVATIAMEALEPIGGMTTRSAPWAEVSKRDGLVSHPAMDELPHYVALRLGDGRIAVGFIEKEGVWRASADLNEDGEISDTEEVVLEQEEDDGFHGVLYGMTRRSLAGGESIAVPIRLRVMTALREEVQVCGGSAEMARQGRLPNGTRFQVRSSGGVFDHPRVKVTVDEDGDGEPDVANRLVSYFGADGVLEANGERWAFTVSPDGSVFRLSEAQGPPPGLRVGQQAPNFEVIASDGEVHTLARYRGRALLIDFWATWCAPCIALHPEVEALAKRYEIDVLGISADSTQRDVDLWLRKNPTPWPTASVGPDGAVNAAYGIDMWPSHALIDGEGRLVTLGGFEAIERALAASGMEKPEPMQ